jgi:hypothetical protein
MAKQFCSRSDGRKSRSFDPKTAPDTSRWLLTHLGDLRAILVPGTIHFLTLPQYLGEVFMRGQKNMATFLYPGFLTNPQEYRLAELLWHDHWDELVGRAGQREQWRTPWLRTTFADGTPCGDGNPIFSAICPTRALGIRLIQLQPSGMSPDLSFWIDRFDEGIRELVIACALSKETLLTALNLMNQWMTKQQAQLFRNTSYPNSLAVVQDEPPGNA